MDPRTRTPLVFVLALVAPAVVACTSRAAVSTARVAPSPPGSVLVPVTPSQPPPAAPPPAPPAEPPVEPGPGNPGPNDECRSDADCPAGFACQQHILAACPACAGGTLIMRCDARAAVLPPDPPEQGPPADCPPYVNCMPSPDRTGPCPSPEFSKRCPNTTIAW